MLPESVWVEGKRRELAKSQVDFQSFELSCTIRPTILNLWAYLKYFRCYITLPTKVRLVKAMVFPVVTYGCESWTIKKAERWRIDAFELWCWKSPLDCKEIKPVHPKGDQSWVFIGSTDVEAETPILWPPDAKSWLIGKDPDAGKDWGQEKGMTEVEMFGCHHRLNGHGFGWTSGVDDREAWHAAVHGVSKSRIWLNDWTELNWRGVYLLVYLCGHNCHFF